MIHNFDKSPIVITILVFLFFFILIASNFCPKQKTTFEVIDFTTNRAYRITEYRIHHGIIYFDYDGGTVYLSNFKITEVPKKIK